MSTDNNKTLTAVSKYALVTLAVSVVLIAVSLWIVYSLSREVGVAATAVKPDLPVNPDGLTQVRDYNPDPPVDIDRQQPFSHSRAIVTVTQVPDTPKHHRSVKQKVNKPVQEKNDDSLHDMFPVGNIAEEQPREPAPREAQSFSYDGKTWSATGNYITADQADLVPTGDQLEDGRQLYSLDSTDTSDEDMIFVQSMQDPDDFAIYESS